MLHYGVGGRTSDGPDADKRIVDDACGRLRRPAYSALSRLINSIVMTINTYMIRGSADRGYASLVSQDHRTIETKHEVCR